MSSDIGFVEFVCDQMKAAGTIRYRKMFGEYAVYCDDIIVGLVCEDQFFMKPTAAGRDYIGNVVEAPPYPGAKMYFLIDGGLDDASWLSGLISASLPQLPPPKPKKPKSQRPGPAN